MEPSRRASGHINILKSKGEKVDPGGTPQETLRNDVWRKMYDVRPIGQIKSGVSSTSPQSGSVTLHLIPSLAYVHLLGDSLCGDAESSVLCLVPQDSAYSREDQTICQQEGTRHRKTPPLKSRDTVTR
ncbi:hypothetical protein NDU88_000811 [Pleurodeles waltl]|uniref:Uncharacterized protein n=1 Tax=Pleurodeles waltl TaxID=8319 RepID=A0AAV7ND12_PLEWA|nr:hypothetical protein NDU88_000811 [Pleurodeles waltl]